MKFKRIVSIILAGSMLATSNITGFAADNTVNGLDEEVIFIDESDNTDESSDEASTEISVKENTDLPKETEETTETTETEESEEATEEATEETSTDIEEEKEVSTEEDIEQIEIYGGYNFEEDTVEIIENAPVRLLRSAKASYPSEYKTELLPPLRDQSPYGTCWAFATTALVEISLLKNNLVSDVDLSELHLSYFTYNSAVDPLGGTAGDYMIYNGSNLLNRGGNYEPALAALSQWTGAADEETAKYDRDDIIANSTGLQTAIAFDDFAHVQNYNVVDVSMGSFRNSGDLSILDPIKKLVMENGAVGMSFKAQNGYAADTNESIYNSANNCYYNPENNGAGHAVAIVGWNDDFPKEKFGVQPQGNGAFLIRNSWMTEEDGSTDSYSGYFWMSYYEATMRDRFVAVDAELADNYDNNYQYDGGYTNHSFTRTAGANVFTAHAEDGAYGEVLKSVAFYSAATNIDYVIEIYKDVVDTPDSGVLCEEATTSGRIEFAGFHTIKLENSVYLEAGNKFAVVVRFSSDGLVQEFSYNNSDGGLASRSGESYKLYSGTWEDCGTSGNFKIKAYTDNADASSIVAAEEIVFENVDGDNITLNVGETFKVSAKVMPATASDKKIVWTSSDENVATVVNGQIVVLAEGNAVITASVMGGMVKKAINLTAKNGLLAVSLKRYQVFEFIEGGSYIKYEAAFSPKGYVPKEKVVWTSSDEDVVSIDQNGRLTRKMMGKSTITATVEGKTAQSVFTVDPSWDYFDYEVSDDNVVTLKWQPAKNAITYRIYRNGSYITSIDDDGSESYEFKDEYFKDTDTKSAYYHFGFDNNGTVRFDITLSSSNNIYYELNGGVQNPSNPTKYHSGKACALYEPTAPEGYDFAGWYTDAKFTKYKGSISSTDNGDITLYARYTPKAPELIVDRTSVVLPQGGSVQINAKYIPLLNGTATYNWSSSNVKVAKVSARGGVATITAGDILGNANITVKCKGLTKVIPVSVKKLIWIDNTNLAIRMTEGSSGQIVANVIDEYADTPIVWESADESIATVTENGTVYPNENLRVQSDVVITATISGTDYSATCMVTVIPKQTAKAPSGVVDGKELTDATVGVVKGSLFKLDSDTMGAKVYYALDGKEPAVDENGNPTNADTILYKEALKISAPTTVKAIAYKAGSNVSDVKTYTFTIVNNAWGDIKNEAIRSEIFGDDSNNVPNTVWYIMGNENDGYLNQIYTVSDATGLSVPYTGTAITINDKVNVYHGTRKLVEGRDYTLTYKNNTVAAPADDKKAPSVVVRGKGSYASTATLTFSIEKISMDNAEISSETEVPVLVGKNVKLVNTKPQVKYAGKVLRLGTDYTLSYYEDSIDGTLITDINNLRLTDAGKTYVIAVTAGAKSNFVGTMTKYVTVKTQNPAKTVFASRLKVVDAKGKVLKFNYDFENPETIDLVALFDNNGEGKEPQAFVKDGKNVLVYGVDYVVEEVQGYDYKTAGKHKYVIRGIAKDDTTLTNYVGSKTETIEITGTALSRARFAGLNTSVEFTGKAITLEDLFNTKDRIAQKEGWNEVTLYNTVAKVNVPLTMSTDGVTGDYIVNMPEKIYPGTFTVEFVGINGYTGTVKKTVTIKTYNVGTDLGKRLDVEIGEAVYCKSGAKPETSVRFVVDRYEDGTAKTTIDLREGIDYTLTYKNNTKVAKATDKAAPAVVIRGIGNYTGSNAAHTFTIDYASISSAYLVVADVRYNAKGKNGYFYAVPKIYQDDKALTIGKGRDIEAFNKKDLEYTYAEDTVLGDANGTLRYDGERVLSTDAVLPGTLIKVGIKSSKLGCSEKSYFRYNAAEGDTEICGYYRIIDPNKSLSKYTIQLRNPNKSFFNNGNEIMLTESDFSVYTMVKKNKVELDVSDYKIKSVKNNKLVGSATVVLEGRGEYNGTKNVVIRISAKKIDGK